jgi:hypothetical protein
MGWTMMESQQKSAVHDKCMARYNVPNFPPAPLDLARVDFYYISIDRPLYYNTIVAYYFHIWYSNLIKEFTWQKCVQSAQQLSISIIHSAVQNERWVSGGMVPQ